MRMGRVYIEGFGIFHDKDILLAPGLNIVHGPNEAGKSTLLAFIQQMLFGFPDGRSKVRSYQALRGGRRGGRIVINDSQDQAYTIERFGSASGGELTVRLPDGNAGTEAHLVGLLGQASRDVFCKVFAFGLGELQEFTMLQDEGVRAHIYSAGTGGIAITEIERDMSQRAEALFGPQAHVRPINKALIQVDSLDRQLREIAHQTVEYDELMRQVEGRQGQVKEDAKGLDQLQQGLATLERLQEAWDAWRDLRDVEKELGEIEEVEGFPDQGLERLDKFQEQLTERQQEIDDLEDEVRSEVQKAESLVVDGKLLSQASEVEALRSDRNRYEEQYSELTRREQELMGGEEELMDSLRRLGRNWDEAQLEALDDSIPVQEEIRQFQERLHYTERDHHDTEVRFEETERQLTESQQELTGAQDKLERLDALDEEQIRLRHRALDKVQRLLGQYEVLGGVGSPNTEVPGLPLWPAYVLGLLGIVGGTGLGSTVGILTGIIAGGVLAIAALVYGFIARRQVTARRAEPVDVKRDAGATARLKALELELLEATTVLELKSIPSEKELEVLRERLDKESGDLQAWSMQRVFLEDQQKRAARHEQELKKIREQLGQCTAAREDAKETWCQWLCKHGLTETLSPEGGLDLLNEARSGREKLKVVEGLRQRVAAHRSFVQEYEERTCAVADICGQDSDSGRGVLSLVDRLIQELEEVRGIAQQKKTLDTQLSEHQVRLEHAQQRYQTIEDELQQLLGDAKVEGIEAFSRLGRAYIQRIETRERQQRLQQNLERLVGVGAKYEQALTKLAETSPVELENEVDLLRQQIDQQQVEAGERHEQLGRLRKAIEDIESQEEAADLRLGREAELEQLRAQVHEWCITSMARALLGEAREFYEQERRPGVIREAEQFFKGMTENCYTRVLTPMDRDILVEDRQGGVRELNALSRGTAEQLYLSLRMGLIREFAQKVEALPVIMDDIMVNFDPERAHSVAEAVGRLAHDHQVVLLTCHQSTVELFSEVCADELLNVISLDREAAFSGWVSQATPTESVVISTNEVDGEREVLGEKVLALVAGGGLKIGDLEIELDMDRERIKDVLDMLRNRGEVDTEGHGRGARWVRV